MALQPDQNKKPLRHLPLLGCLLVILAISLHFCLWKSGMFIDEIYTYGLSNSSYMPLSAMVLPIAFRNRPSRAKISLTTLR